MEKSPTKNRLFDQEEDFGKELWDAVGKMRHDNMAADPSCDHGKLYERYQWLKKFLTWRTLADKEPTTLLDHQGRPLVQDVYALRHLDCGMVRRIAEEYDRAGNEHIDEIDKKYAQTIDRMLSHPKPVFYYRLCPDDYFTLYDAPFFMYLYAKHGSQTGRHTIRMKDCPPCYQQIFVKTLKAQGTAGWFGVTVHQSDKLGEGDVISVPDFCERGRLEAFQRFILCRGRATRVHAFRYFTRLLPYHETLESVPDFEEEDAWYFEMCSGLSLVTEITALLEELGVSISDVKKNDHAMVKWSDCRMGIIRELLREHRESIIRCPAIYWRAASLRNAIRQTDYQFMMKELKWERQIKLAYTEDPMEPCLQTVETWCTLAREQFDQYFFRDLSMIGIDSEEFRWDQFKKHMGVKSSEDILFKPAYPEASAFMSAAQDMVMKRLYAGVERYKRFAMKNAVVDQYTAGMQSNGFYFRGCLPQKDPVVEKMIKTARRQSQPVDGTAPEREHLKKLRNTNPLEEIFDSIHKTLYGNGTNCDPGFFHPEDL